MLLFAGAALAEDATRTVGNVVVVTAGPRSFPFNRPFDLQGRTIRFTPDGSAYRVDSEPIQWIDDHGALLDTFTSPSQFREVPLAGFAFPFGGSNRTSLIFDGAGGIRFEPPQVVPNAQLYDVHIAGIDQPLISPLLRSSRVQPERSVFFRQESAFIVATWIEGAAGTPIDEVQAVLRSDGSILFSYKRASPVLNGAVVVTTGAGPWRENRDVLATIIDTADDVSAATPADLRAMMDLREVEVVRLAASDLMEVRIRTAGPIDRRAVAQRRVRYSIDVGAVGLNSGVDVFVSASTLEYRPGNWTRVPIAAPALTIEGDTLRVRLSDEMIDWREAGNTVAVIAALEEFTPLDAASAPIARGQVNAPAATDLSAGSASRTGPVFETFTRGYLNPYEVWDSTRRALALRDDEIDAVLIYTELFLDLPALGLAYSTVGNSGAAGVMLPAEDHDPVGPLAAVRPALLLLAATGPDLPLLIHEFGHRWLMNVQINRGEGNSLVLNQEFHPTPLMHNPSAFPKRVGETSCMGGTNFVEGPEGTFTASRESTCGYSWLELYLMGLAAPEEVAPFFYLENPDRPIPAGPLAPPIQVRATKRTVGIDDLIRGMGPRVPSVATSRKTFRVVFVVVDSPAEPASETQLATIDALRGSFADEFARVTGGRGEIRSSLPSRDRRRTIRR